jgi:hypothetical protein
MKISIQKLYLVLLSAEHKLAMLTGNTKVEQDTQEKLVLYRTHMRVEQEQVANKLLFNTL